jgi:hypothetical protein
MKNKDIINNAIKVLEEKISNYTGYIHHNYGVMAITRDTIPLNENLCYILALLRTCNIDNFYKAQNLLDKILPFQNTDRKDRLYGGFVKYLHEYPNCYDISVCMNIAVSLMMIYHQIKKLVKLPYKEKIKTSIDILLQYIANNYNKKNVAKTYLLSCMEGCWYNKPMKDITCKGYWDNISSDDADNILLSMQLLCLFNKKEIADKIYYKFINHFHPIFKIFAGQFVNEYQHGYFFKLTLCDLFFIDDIKSMVRKIPNEADIWMRAPLLYYFYNDFDNTKNTITPPPMCCYEQYYSTFLLDRKNTADVNYNHIMRVVWKDDDNFYSLVANNDKYFSAAEKTGSGAELLFNVTKDDLVDDEFIISLYIEDHPGTYVLVNDRKATVFRVEEDVITIKTPKVTATLKLRVNGDAVLLGHIFKSNRPSQLLNIKKSKDAFDWMIGVRCVNTLSDFDVKLALSLDY